MNLLLLLRKPNYIEEAIRFLRRHEPPEGYFVGFSGGKDSIVCEHLCGLAGVKFELWHSCTRIDPPEVYKFIKEYYPECHWAYPRITFWEGIKKKMPPMKMRRWCCDELKKYPTKDVPLKHRVMGIRAEESNKRKLKSRVEKIKYHQTGYYPIFHWKEWQVWEFIEKYSLPYPSLYDEGFHRIGCCVGCPFIFRASQGELYKHMIRWPALWRIFEKTLEAWYNQSGRSIKEEFYKTFSLWLAAYYRGFENPKSYIPPIKNLADALEMQRTIGHYSKEFRS